MVSYRKIAMVVLKRPVLALIVTLMILIISSVLNSNIAEGEIHAEIVTKNKVMIGEAVFFDGSHSSSSTTDTMNYSWDVDGDGKADAYDKYFTGVYSNSGTYSITLTVTAGNVSDIATATIVVESAFTSLLPYFGLTAIAIALLVLLGRYWRKKDIDNLQLLKKEKAAVPINRKIKKIVKKKAAERPQKSLSSVARPVLKKKKIKTEAKPAQAVAQPQTPQKEEKPAGETVACPSCGKTISAFAVICESCGAMFSDEYVCTSCGATVLEDWGTCPKCGAKLT